MLSVFWPQRLMICRAACPAMPAALCRIAQVTLRVRFPGWRR